MIQRRKREICVWVKAQIMKDNKIFTFTFKFFFD